MENTSNKAVNLERSLFWLSQMVILPALLIGGFLGFAKVNELPSIPKLNRNPRVVRPEHNQPLVISDEQLEVVLYKLRPRFETQPPKTNFVDHALRMWGVEIEFGDSSIDGSVMRSLLTDHRLFRQVWGEHEPPLLTENQYGIAVRMQEGRSTVSHMDHLLGSLAEVGTPLDFEVVSENQTGTMLDLLRHASRTFSLNQREYEWTALALAFYAADGEPWYSSEGQEINFDRLVSRIMREQQPDGVCYGQHRLYTLTLLLRIDSQMSESSPDRLLSAEARQDVIDYLSRTTRAVYRTQSPEGYWDGNWPDTSIPVRDPETDPVSRRILATGHMLEWWAMAPAELHPPRESIVRAGQWLTRVIIEMDEARIQSNFTFLSHAGRALALWRGKFPAEAFRPQVWTDADAPMLEFEPDPSQSEIDITLAK